jgi:autotransporter-associated beta strand protein
MQRRRRNWLLPALLVAAALCSRVAVAQVTWTGTAGTGDWATPGAFADSSGGLTLANGFNRAFVFAGTPAIVSTTNTLTGGTATSFTFNAGASPFTLDGSAITLSGSITNNSTNVQTIAMAMSQTVFRTVTMTAGGGGVTLSGILSGTGGYALAGTGTLRMTGNNSYAGNTQLGAGTTLVLGHQNALGTSGTMTFFGAGSFDVTTGSSFTIPNNVYLSNANATFLGSGNLSLTGTLQFGGAARTLTVSAGTLTTPQINPEGSSPTTRQFIKAGNGTLVVTGPAGANFQGGFRHEAGLLILGTGSAVGTGLFDLAGGTLQGQNDLRFTNAGNSGQSTISGSRSVEFSGTYTGNTGRSITNSIVGGTLTFSGMVNSGVLFSIGGSGATIVSGTVRNTNPTGGHFQISTLSSGTTTISGLIQTSTATLGRDGTAGVIVVTNSNFLASTTAVAIRGGILVANAPLSIAGPVSHFENSYFRGPNDITFSTGTFAFAAAGRGIDNQLSPGATLTFAGPVSIAGVTGYYGLNSTGTGNTVFSGTISGGLATTDFRLGSGTATLLAANTYSGTTSLPGTLVLGNNAALGSSVLLPAAATAVVRANTAVSTTNAVFLRPANLTVAGTNSVGFGSLTNFVTSRVIQNNLSDNATLSFSGTTFLQESGTGVGRNLIIAGPGNTTFSNAIVNGGTAGLSTITIDSTGTTTFSGANAYFGTTTVNAGVLLLSTTAAVSGSAARTYTVSGSAVIATGFAVDQSFLLRTATASSGVIALAANSSGNLDFSAATGASLPSVSLGAIGPATRVYSGTLTPNGGTYRLGGGGGTLDFQGPLAGGNAVVLGGGTAGVGGTVLLSSAPANANSYTGKTTLQSGLLEISSIANVNGGNSSLGAPTNSTDGTIDLGSGTNVVTLRYVGSGHSTDRVLNVTGGGAVIDSSGSGPVSFTGGVSNSGNATLTLAGSSTGDNYITAVTGSNVTKTGVGTWVFGTNSFTGRLAIEQGTIVATGNAPGGSGTSSSLGRQNGPIPVIGLANATGTAALLAANGVTISRVIEVAALGSGDQEVVLGGSGPGTATYDANSAFRLGRGVTLAADPGGNVRFLTPTANWDQQDGSENPAVAVTIGTPTATGTVTLETTLPNSLTSVTVRQGTLRLGNGTTVGALGPSSVLTGSAGATLAFNRSDTISSGVHFANSIGGAMNVRQQGSGTVALTGVNTYTGATDVVAGTLEVDGVLGNTAVTVALGATLSGTGTIGGPTTIYGTHAPGSSPGIETFTSGLTYGATSTLVWELIANTDSPASRGVLFDGVDLTGGALSILSGATLSLVFDLPGSTVDWDDAFWGTNRSWTVIDVAGGTWNSSLFTLQVGDDSTTASLTSKRPDASFQIVDLGGDLVLEYVIVPEPGTLALTAIGLAAAAWGYRRRGRERSRVG